MQKMELRFSVKPASRQITCILPGVGRRARSGPAKNHRIFRILTALVLCAAIHSGPAAGWIYAVAGEANAGLDAATVQGARFSTPGSKAQELIDHVASAWDRLALIFNRAPLGDRDPAILRQRFINSGARCFAWVDQELIGAGRAITDGIRYAAIFDVVVLPEYQNRGVGKQIMANLIAHSGAENVLLHSVPGKEGYYSKFGFRKIKTAMARFKNPQLQQELGYIE